MIDLSCQFEMYANVMMKNNKMVQDGCVKRTKRSVIPPEAKKRQGLWETKSYVAKCQP